MNIYRHQFVCHCPNNSLPIVYELQIETTETIMVEKITEECAKEKSAFHEKLADKFLSIFGGRQILKAHHHGVDIETIRSGVSDEAERDHAQMRGDFYS